MLDYRRVIVETSFGHQRFEDASNHQGKALQSVGSSLEDVMCSPPGKWHHILGISTLSPIIMVQWKMGAWKMTLVSKGAIFHFHFHDYGRKGRSNKNVIILKLQLSWRTR